MVLEQKKDTIKSADLVVSNSPYLRDYAKPNFYVGQGCDFKFISIK
jgi:hypothetical protein